MNLNRYTLFKYSSDLQPKCVLNRERRNAILGARIQITRAVSTLTREDRHEHPVQHEAASLPRLRPLPSIKVSVQELDQDKLSPLLQLKNNDALAEAVDDLGRPEEIGMIFSGFQKTSVKT
jgi:hypothetical protein